MAEPSPAPAWTTTSWPWSASSRAPDGVSATRYSSVLISVGALTFTSDLARSGGGGDVEATAALGELGEQVVGAQRDLGGQRAGAVAQGAAGDEAHRGGGDRARRDDPAA